MFSPKPPPRFAPAMPGLALRALRPAGCEPHDEMFPVNPGGNGGMGGSTQPDAAVDAAGDGGGPITGRVCLLVTNLRGLRDCAATGAEGLTVALGSAMATTSATGSFTIQRPANTTNAVWSVTGAGIVPSLQPFTAITSLPAIEAAAYQEMVTANQVATDGGAIMMRVTRAGVAVMGAKVAAVPAPVQILYDGVSDEAWDVDATGAFGVAWMPSVQPGNVDLTVTFNQMQTAVNDAPVAANAITCVFAEIHREAASRALLARELYLVGSMKSVAFVLLLCAACEPSQLDYPIQPSTSGPHSSGVVGGGTLVDAGTSGDDTPDNGDGGVPGADGGSDGGALSDAGGLGPDAAPQLDAGVPDFFDASVPPMP